MFIHRYSIDDVVIVVGDVVVVVVVAVVVRHQMSTSHQNLKSKSFSRTLVGDNYSQLITNTRL